MAATATTCPGITPISLPFKFYAIFVDKPAASTMESDTNQQNQPSGENPPPQNPIVHPEDVETIFGLVTAAQDGDRMAFGQLFDELHLPIYRFAVSRTGAPEDAEDIVSETFLEAWRALGKFQWRGAPFKSWLFAIADSRVKNHARKKSRRNAASEAIRFEQSTPRIDPSPALQHSLGDHAEVKKMLDGLNDAQRTVLVLRFYGGFSTEEIANHIGKSEVSVRQIQLKALERIGYQLRHKKRNEDASGREAA